MSIPHSVCECTHIFAKSAREYCVVCALLELLINVKVL